MDAWDAEYARTLERSGEAQRLVAVDLAGLQNADMDPTRYAVEPILPRNVVTLLASHGGAGKSMLALTLAAHVACGRLWCRLPAIQGRVLFVSLEDRGDLVRYRLKRIAEAYRLDMESITEGLLVLDGTKGDSVLATEVMEEGVRRLHTTATMEELRTAAEGRSLIVIDNASDAYDANENDRRQVRTFVRHLGQIAMDNDAAMLMLAHIDKLAARQGSNGNTYSGSTAWHNSARSRLALTESSGRIELVQEKNNLGKKAEPIPLAWDEHGVLVPADTNPAAVSQADGDDDEAVYAAIDKANASGISVPTGRVGAMTTLSVLKTLPDLPQKLRKDKDRFWAAVSRLERAELIVRETYKTPARHVRERLKCARSKSPIPPAIQRTQVRADCSIAPNSNSERIQRIGAKGCRCGGEGCQWCAS